MQQQEARLHASLPASLASQGAEHFLTFSHTSGSVENLTPKAAVSPVPAQQILALWTVFIGISILVVKKCSTEAVFS